MLRARPILAAHRCAKRPRQGAEHRPPFTQRRQLKRKHAQSIEEIFPKLSFLDGLRQIAVGGGDHAHVHLPRCRTPNGVEFALLQDAEQFRLKVEGQFTDLVEEDRPLVGERKPALSFLGRPGIGAGFMSEELALDQCGGWLRSSR